jgi:hypothetical protein
MLRPLFTGQVFLAPCGLNFEDSGELTEKLRAGMLAGVWSAAQIEGMVIADSIPCQAP